MQAKEDDNVEIANELSFFKNGKNVETVEGAFWKLKRLDTEKRNASLLEALVNIRVCLQAYRTHCELTSDGLWFCLGYIIPLLGSDNDDFFGEAFAILDAILPLAPRDCVSTAMKSKALSISKTIVEKLEKMRDKDDSRWCKTWCLWIRMLLQVFVHPKEMSSVNSVMKVVERGFKHANTNIRTLSFICWQDFLRILVEQKQLIGNRITFTSIPLCYTTHYNDSLAEEKFTTWWYFLCHIKESIQPQNHTIVVAFLKFCFGPYTSIEEDDMTKNLIVSPGKNVPKLHGKVICALIHLLGVSNDETKVFGRKHRLTMDTDSIVNVEIFKNIEKDAILSCQEATILIRSLGDLHSYSISRNLWQNLLRLLPKDNILTSLRTLCDVLNIFRLQCEKDNNFQHYMRILVQEMTSINYKVQPNAPESGAILMEIFENLIEFFLNTPNDILKHDDTEQLCKVLFQMCGKSTNELCDNVLHVVTKVEVLNRKNLSSFYVFFTTFTKFIVTHQRNNISSITRADFNSNLSGQLFNWAMKNITKYPNKRDIVSYFGPILKDMEKMRIKSYFVTLAENLEQTEKELAQILISHIKRKSDASKLDKSNDDSFVEIIPQSTKLMPLKTNLLTESQRDKMCKRAEDIPALYNDLTGDSMPPLPSSSTSQSESNSVVEATQLTAIERKAIAKKSRILRELDKLKTNTVAGQQLIIPKRSRGKSATENEEKDVPKDAKSTNDSETKRKVGRPKGRPTKGTTNEIAINATEKSTPQINEHDSGVKRTTRRSLAFQDPVDKANSFEDSSLFENIEKTPIKSGKLLHDHMYHLQKTPSPRKKAKTTSTSSPVKNDVVDDVNEELVSQMLRNVMEHGFHSPQDFTEDTNIDGMLVAEEVEIFNNEKTPEKQKMCLDLNKERQDQEMKQEVRQLIRVKAFGMDTTGTQNLFSDTPEESPSQLQQPKVPEIDISNADTQIQTPIDETIVNSLPESLNVECNTQVPMDVTTPNSLAGDVQECSEKDSSPGLLTKTLVRIPQKLDGKSHKHSHHFREIYKVKETSKRTLPSPVALSSPKFTSRAAQMLSMTASSPSTSKQVNASARKAIQSPAKEDLFRFSPAGPPLNATPKLSILKRKRESNLNDSDMTSKKRRIHFHDPPVTRTKEYILEESEKTEKLRVNAMVCDGLPKENLLKDSPPPPPAEVPKTDDWEDLEDDWEDFEDDTSVTDEAEDVKPPLVSVSIATPTKKLVPKRKKRQLVFSKELERNCNSAVESTSKTVEKNEIHELADERKDGKLLFFSDQEVFQYVNDNMDQFIDSIFEEDNDSPMNLIQKILCHSRFREKMHLMSKTEMIDLLINTLQLLKN